jgi:hypothetical protein
MIVNLAIEERLEAVPSVRRGNSLLEIAKFENFKAQAFF